MNTTSSTDHLRWWLLLVILGWASLYALPSFAQEATTEEAVLETDSVQVFFRQGKTALEPSFRNNDLRLASFARRFEQQRQNPEMKVKGIRITSSASPEGTLQVNERVSRQRANSIVHYMDRNFSLSPNLFEVKSLDINWHGLREMVEESYSMPYREEVLDLLWTLPRSGYLDEVSSQQLKKRLGQIGGGRAWSYMYSNFFPDLRQTIVHITYQQELLQPPEPPKPPVVQMDTLVVIEREEVPVILRDTVEVLVPRDPFYMSLRTNLLADLSITPNIGIEFYVDEGFSLLGSWTGAWWHNDENHFYWRIYGGELEVRKYFGKMAQEKPLQGHHLGVYGQWYTWDFAFGKDGYKSDKGSWGVGVNYGYSLPITKRLNIDLGIGVGYMRGEYEIGAPRIINGQRKYVWKETNLRNYFGPTKAYISLVWLIGNGNYNKDK